MHWIENYQLFLFDCDGILVNTEALHYLAYKQMCAEYGFLLKWDLKTYLSYALFDADGVREALYKESPALEQVGWERLYQAKKGIYTRLLEEQGVELMPGVEALLRELERRGVKRGVVTHSSAAHVALLRAHHPVLDSIPVWITREDYLHPKPASDCYQEAIARLATAEDKIIGFEDSPRGLRALLGTAAEGVLVTDLFSSDEIHHISRTVARPFRHIPAFTEWVAP